MTTSKKQQILALRSQGMKYRDIAEKVGVSFQYAAIVCGKADITKFRALSETDCVFPGLRRWMNTERVSKSELSRRMGFCVSGNASKKLSDVLRGKTDPTKAWIDRLISATGLPYEHLFSREVKR